MLNHSLDQQVSNFSRASETPEGLIKTQTAGSTSRHSHSVSLRWDQRIFIVMTSLVMPTVLVWGAHSKNHHLDLLVGQIIPLQHISSQENMDPALKCPDTTLQKEHMIWDTGRVGPYNHIARTILPIQKPKCPSLDRYDMAILKWLLRAIDHLLSIPMWKLLGLWANCITRICPKVNEGCIV